MACIRFYGKPGETQTLRVNHFFSGANGYKLRLLTEPSGDLSRSDKNGYVSFYLVIMTGKYDAILPWPFRPTVIFRLISKITQITEKT